MFFSYLSSFIITIISALVAIAFFTLLERKILGYIQLRKGPNKVGIAGIPQPFADALKLFAKELNKPTLANIIPFIIMPILGLFLALILWITYPFSALFFLKWSILFFLAVSRLNVYTTLLRGWASNSKYSLLGALRRIAQTISYEVRIALTVLSPLLFISTLRINELANGQISPLICLIWPLGIVWFITTLAETNRTPFDLAEGESELVSGFNTEYRSGTFALIFIAEYLNIIAIRIITASVFLLFSPISLIQDMWLSISTCIISVIFLWTRGSYPRMRYDKLIDLTWKQFLPITLSSLILVISIV